MATTPVSPQGTPSVSLGTAGLTPQMSIVNADRTPTVFFFRWLLNTRSESLGQTPWTSDIDAAGFALDNLGSLTLKGPVTFPDGTVQTTAFSAAAGIVSSVFGRTGVVTARAGDYSVGQVTGAAAQAITISAGAGLSGGGDLTANRTLALVPATATTIGGVKIGANISVAADGTISVAAAGGAGTVTSVDISLPPEFTVSGNPITTAGVLAIAKASQAPNLVWASPASGSGAPYFRALVAADIPGGVGQNQTPWLSDINANNFQLYNVPTINGNGNLTLAAGGAGTVTLQTNAKPRLAIDSAGHVTINAPDSGSAALSLASNLAFTGTNPSINGIYALWAPNGSDIQLSNGSEMYFQSIGGYHFQAGNSGQDSLVLGSNGALTFAAAKGQTTAYFYFAGVDIYATNASDLNFYLNGNLAINLTSGKNRVNLSSAGNFLIQQPDTGNHLTLNGASGSTAVLTAGTGMNVSVNAPAALGLFGQTSVALQTGASQATRLTSDSAGHVTILAPDDANPALNVIGLLHLTYPSSGTGAGMWLDSSTTASACFVGYDTSLTNWRVYSKALSGNCLTVDLAAGNVVIGFGAAFVGTFSTAVYDSLTPAGRITVGNPTAGQTVGGILTLVGNSAVGQFPGQIAFTSASSTVADKRLAAVTGQCVSDQNSGQLIFATANSGTLAGRVWITNAGAVGIATNAPVMPLDIAANPQPGIGFYSTGGVAGHQRARLVYDGGQNVTGGGFVFQALTDSGGFGASLVTILQSNGYVGIGTLTPAYTLDVNGSLRITAPLTFQDGTQQTTAAGAGSLNHQFASTSTALVLSPSLQQIPNMTITIPVTGTYVLEAMVLFYGNTATCVLQFYLNGSAILSTGYSISNVGNAYGTVTGQYFYTPGILKVVRACNAGEKYTIGCAQNGNPGVQEAVQAYMTAMKIG